MVLSAFANTMVGIVAVEHLYIMVLQMFMWETARARKAFGITDRALQTKTKPLACNQGLYNGFVAAGLLRGLYLGGEVGNDYKFFFLGCVAVAGCYGAITVLRKIFYIQGVPAIIALVLLYSSL
eukprot:CFRG6056T1